MAIWQRLYNFVSGTRISSSQVDAELDQIITALNQHTNDIATGDTNTLNFTKQYGLGSTAQDITGQNLNSIDVTGFYYGSGLINGPTITGPTGTVSFTEGYLLNIKKGGTQRKQFFTDYNSSKFFMRTQYSSVWVPSGGLNGGWIEIFNTDIQSGFTNLTLTNGATVNNSRTPRFLKIGNVVTLQGEIATIAANTVIATLPAGFRPSMTLVFANAQNTSTANNSCSFHVQSNGQITAFQIGNGTSALCLNNISFIAEQ